VTPSLFASQLRRYDPQIRNWLPAVLAASLAWCAFLMLGSTPIVRASGLALTIMGVAMSLRRMGALLAFTGAIALAFSPAFWSQTGGGGSEPATIVLAVAAAGGLALIITLLWQKPEYSMTVALIVFALVLWSQVGTDRSLRLSGLVTAWLMFLLINTLLMTNPRQDEAPATSPPAGVVYGLLLLLAVGILNDPVMLFMLPGVALGLFLALPRLPAWVWLALFGLGILGSYQLVVVYGNDPMVHFLGMGWRDGARWLDLLRFVVGQFGLAGVGLALFGLARLARWYPPLGVVTMVGFGSYFFLGLIYEGPYRDLLLLPLMIIQVLWMTYSLFAAAQWLQRVGRLNMEQAQVVVGFVYMLLPVSLALPLFLTM
jgi:hypothetical protein